MTRKEARESDAGVTLDSIRAPRIAGVRGVLPEHRYSQEELADALRKLWGEQHHNPRRLDRFHDAVQVGGRNLALEIEAYEELGGFGDANDAFIEVGTDLGEKATRQALDATGLEPTDVDAFFFTTVTGLATPTLDARLINRLGMRRDVRRTPMFGLGCVAGAAGIARMSDYLRAYPDHVAVLLSVELCSLTLQRDDLSVPNLIATGLFGDGAAAVVAMGSRAARDRGLENAPRVTANRSVFYEDTEWVMGWDIGSSGFQVVLSAELPGLIRESLANDVDDFLADHDLTRDTLDAWIAHPGGPAVLEAMEDALDLDADALSVTRRSLREIGNLSSASVLFVLQQTLEEREFDAGDTALLLAMGPGFCAEEVLLEW